MKINLMDPGLVGQAGHHFEWVANIVRQLVARGHSVHVYSHTALPEAPRNALSLLAPVTPIFSAHPFVGPGDARQIDPIAGEYYLYRNLSQTTARELDQTGDADLLLWPTVSAYQLNACALSRRNIPVSCCVHYTPDIGGFKTGATWWRDAFLNMRRSKAPLRCGSFVPSLRKHYLPITADGSFVLFPAPHGARRIEAPREILGTVGFFGAQRPEKGLHILRGLIARFISDGLRVLAHDSYNGLKVHQPSPQLSVIGYVPDLVAEISKCDLVVLPYDPSEYKDRGSAIAYDALAAGIPIIAPFDTVPGDLVESSGAGRTFLYFDEESILRAAADCRASYANVAEAAFRFSSVWNPANGYGPFVDAMIGEVRRVASAPAVL